MWRDKRAVVYGRNSQKARGQKQDSNTLSVDSQLTAGIGWVKQERCVLVGRPYRDDGISASSYSRKERPDWQQVMEHVAAGETDLLVVWEISRATRDRPVWTALMAACQESRVHIVVGGAVHDPNDPDDAFMLDLLAMLAVRESGITSKRVARLVVARAELGRPHGPVKYGYKVEYDPGTGKPVRRVIDPAKVEFLQEIKNRALAGESMWVVAQDLNRRGIPSPSGKTWRGTNLWKLITSPTYAKKRVYRGAVIGTATWPAIFTEEEHNRLVTLGRDPHRKTNHEGTHVKNLLVGIAEAECGGRIGAQHNTNRRPESRVAYTCDVDFCVSRTVARVDELVHGLMAARLSRPDISQLLAAVDGDREAQAAAAEVAKLRRRLDDHYDQATAGDLSAAGLARVEAKLLEQIKKAEHRARPALLPAVVWDVAGTDAERRWYALDLLAQRTIVKALCRVIIHRGAKGGRAPFDPGLIEVRWRGDD